MDQLHATEFGTDGENAKIFNSINLSFLKETY